MIMGVSLYYGAYICNQSRESNQKIIREANRYYVENFRRDIADMTQAVNSIYQNNTDFRELTQYELSEFEWVGAMYSLNKYLAMKAGSINYPGGMYIFDSQNMTLRSTYSSGIYSGDKYEIDHALKRYLLNNAAKVCTTGYFQTPEDTYYCYMLGKKGRYVGFVINLSKYFYTQPNMQILYMWNNAEIIAESGEKIIPLENMEAEKVLSKESKFLKNRNVNLYHAQIAETLLSVAIIQSTDSYLSFLKNPRLALSVVLIPTMLLLLMLYILHLFHQTLIHPVEYLLARVKEMEQGNGELSEREHVQKERIDEYLELNQKIEEFLQKIHSLEQQKYEEEQNANWARLQYYKLQINPHFYLNCLNTVGMLIDKNKVSAANAMLRDLSSHFRYVFQDQRELVTIREELTEIHAFCNIYSLRTDVPVLLDIAVEEQYLEYLIPPLTLQTFVENSIKHRDGLGKILKLTIRLKQSGNGIRIYVTDNGKGYSKEVLEELNAPVDEFIYQSNHVGIDNFKFRMKLIYKDMASFAFYNGEAGGAVSEVTIEEVFREHTNY